MKKGGPQGGRIVMVQGASRGIGLEFVRQLVAREDVALVIASCRNPGGAAELRSIGARTSSLEILLLDLEAPDTIAEAATEVAALVPRLDWLINTAGLLHAGGQAPERRLAEVAPGNLARSFAINASGPILVARHFEALLRAGDVPVFASLSARVGSIADNRLGGWYAYRASKAAQNMLTKTLAIEWARARNPVACVALHPGTVDTDLSRPFQGNVEPEKLFTPERAVSQLIDIVANLGPADSGRFIAWDGSDIPW